MTLYTIQTALLKGGGCAKFGAFEPVCESLIDEIPNIASIQDFSRRNKIDQKSINNKDIADLISSTSAKRKSYFDSLGIILSFGQPDYLPISFLERGLRCSAAVCRITRSFVLKELTSLIVDRNPKELKIVCTILSEFLQVNPKIWEMYPTMSAAFADSSIKPKLEEKADERTDIPYATGFLVGKNYLLTNCHVLNALTEESKDEIKYFKAQFKYQRDAIDRKAKSVEFSFDASLCVSDETLDFTLIRVKKVLEDEYPEPRSPEQQKAVETQKSEIGIDFDEAGENFGWLPMLEHDMIMPPLSRRRVQQITSQLEALGVEQSQVNRLKRQGLSGESMVIIQHPRGREKEIVLFNNRIQMISENLLHYEADADRGSSGSPVFNSDWQLVALHHAALINYRKDGDFEVRSNLGIRISQIVKYLNLRKDEPGVSDFLRQYVKNPTKGRIYILAGRKREGVLNPPYVELEVKLTQAISDWIERNNNKDKSGFEVVQIPNNALTNGKAAIDWINSQNYTVGDIALEILTDAYSKLPPQVVNSSNQPLQPGTPTSEDLMQPAAAGKKLPKGATVYYVGAKSERKTHAGILLQALLNQVPQLSSRETQSDRNTVNGRLPFCREVSAPSLVLYLGFLENSEDCQVLGVQENGELEQAKVETIAQGIYKGLLDWGNTHSPIGFWRP